MKIISLVENTTKCGYEVAHGLSLYIETKKHKILFDVGPDETVFNNAKRANVDLKEVDTIVISHGHDDHGGALDKMLTINRKAKVYVQKSAFRDHFSIVNNVSKIIGLNKNLQTSDRIVLLEGDYDLDDELLLFKSKDLTKCYSDANNNLFEGVKLDKFEHEHNLLIKGDKNVVILGCGHSGVINILSSLKGTKIDYVVGGFHLYSPAKKQSVGVALLEEISCELKKYNNTTFYTCHCTGNEAFDYMKKREINVHYLSCGDSIEIN